MIKTRDFITWALENSSNHSLNNPDGWLSGEDVMAVAKEICSFEPFDYIPPHKKKRQADIDASER